MLTIDIDTGGTMTDALGSDGLRRISVKVDTTPHDYTVSFLACLAEIARRLDYPDTRRLLADVTLIRWSSTITTNVLAERRGSRVGLLVSEGFEESLYGTRPSPIVGELLPAENIIGLPSEPTPAAVLGAVRRLLEGGVRRICVCLKDAFPDAAAERRIKAIIEEQYPDHIIGAVPVLLGSEMAPVSDDQTRAHYSVMNAYTHAQLASSLFKAEDLVRDEYGWAGPLLIGHTNGGVARVGKTKAVDTVESGPVFGTFGGAYLARAYGLDNVLCFDVGGTTAKASIVRGGEPLLQQGGELMGVPVQCPLPMLRSAAVGGGSIARVSGRTLTLGPESMGATPGPACYALGGQQATLTDALLLLGYLDPANFLGGRRRLNTELAAEVIEREIARPLGMSIEMAALSIRDEAVAMMAGLLGSVLEEAGLTASDCALFAYGGNGPMFAALVAARLEIPVAFGFDTGPVFSAFGSSISDVVHSYDRGLTGERDLQRPQPLRALVEALRIQAARDLRGEGFDPQAAHYRWQLQMAEERVAVESRGLASPGSDAEAIAGGLIGALRSAGHQPRDVSGLHLESRYVLGGQTMPKRAIQSAPRQSGSREVRFGATPAPSRPVHRWEALNPHDSVDGPAVINGETFTCPVPPGWRATMDEYGNAKLQRVLF